MPRRTTGRSPQPADPDLLPVDEGRSEAVLLAVDDLQTATADLGWPEATGLCDGLVDALAHLLVDLADGAAHPSPRPTVVGAIGGSPRPVDHAACRAAAASLRRVAPTFEGSPAPWAGGAGSVCTELAELVDQVADLDRTGRLTLAHKGVVLRRLHALQRRLQGLG
ncbi:hypothetical protein ACQE98_04085 [Ornithinimicrobium sp. W1679]|uniref:hypothetical protein n=1 Tax=unclassified Ornithinimicrobium TaxID=2615080 RepID=UPI003CFAB4F7